MTDERDDDPMLHDALVRARTGGAGNPLAGPGAGVDDEGGAAGLGGARPEDPMIKAVEDRAVAEQRAEGDETA